MKVLITTDAFYPMINGVVISTMNLYKELKKIGHDVRILTLSNSGEEKIDGDIYYLKSFKIRVYPDAKVKHLFSGEIEKKLIEWKPDVIHSQTEFSTMLVARYISRKTGAPQIHTYHTMYEEYLNYILNGKLVPPGMVGKIARALFNRMDGVVVPTEKMKNFLLRYRVDVPMYVVPTGLEIDRFQNKITPEEKEKLLDRYGLRGCKVLVYVGRIAEEKNIEEVIEYYSNVSLKADNVKLLIVGGGPYLDKLKELVDRLQICEKVIFTGMINPSEVQKYYQLGHVFVTSSTSETQGLTYIEAMASGVPVICRYDPCIDGLIINGKNGYTYKNQTEFTQSVLRIINNEEHRSEAAYTAEEKAKEYSCEIFGERISSIYDEVITKPKSERGFDLQYKVSSIFHKFF